MKGISLKVLTLSLAMALAVIFVMDVATQAMAQQPNVGVFDLQKVLNDSKKGSAARKKLEANFKKKQEDLKKKEGDITKLDGELRKMVESRTAKQEDMRKKSEELQKKMADYQSQLAKANSEMAKEEEDALKPLVDRAVKAASDLGRERNYIMVIEVQQAGVVYALDTMDLTGEIIKIVDK